MADTPSTPIPTPSTPPVATPTAARDRDLLPRDPDDTGDRTPFPTWATRPDVIEQAYRPRAAEPLRGPGGGRLEATMRDCGTA